LPGLAKQQSSEPPQQAMNKKLLSERDICTKFITPALRQAGWDEMSQIREEVSFTIKNPHTVADDYGDPEVLLESLNAAEAETASLRDQLKAILAEALTK
jgi:hypothetical protein